MPVEPKIQTEDRAGSVRAVERAASLIAALAEQRGSIAVGELASRMGLHPATTYRLLSTLVQIGWVEQVGNSSRYRPGALLTGIGAMSLANSALVHQSQEVLRRLTAFSGFNCYISVLVGSHVTYLSKSQAQPNSTSHFEVGMSHPFYTMADGKLLVAHLPAERRAAILAETDYLHYTPFTTVDTDQLEDEFVQIRERGYATDVGGRFDFLRGLAVPILGQERTVIASLLCFGRLDLSEEQETRLSEEMKLLADELSYRLS